MIHERKNSNLDIIKIKNYSRDIIKREDKPQTRKYLQITIM